MNTTPSPTPPPVKVNPASVGVPGAEVRSRGITQAMAPFISMAFGAGWVFGAIVSPGFLVGWHAALLLLLMAAGLAITWKRAVLILVRHEEGARGEEQVARVLDALPEDWRVYHGVKVGDRRVDHVVMSPSQVFSIETVHWQGSVRVLNGKLLHGENLYPGYELPTLAERGGQLAGEMELPAERVIPMVCIVGGRFGGHPGINEGVWLGEIQDMGLFLLQNESDPLAQSDAERAAEWLEKATLPDPIAEGA